MIYFFASMPRSGSTLLASLLSQREDTFVSPTSGLGETLKAIIKTLNDDISGEAGGLSQDEIHRILKAIVEQKYVDRDEPVVFDKGRIWPFPHIMETMEKVLGEKIKIIATVRSVAECVASFYMVDKSELSELPMRQWIRTSWLYDHFVKSYDALKQGYEKYPDQFCIVEYDNLCKDPQKELNRVADFIGMPHVVYNPKIEQVDENDNAWSIPDLHKLGTSIKKTEMDTHEILGDELSHLFQGGEFWSGEPEPKKLAHPLDLALEAGLHGNTEKAEQILREILRKDPDSNRAKFNLGLYEMMKGNLLRGHKLLDHGRLEGVWGDAHNGSVMPIWTGERDCTVLLELEGGLGDQFHCIRYAKEIAKRGCKVIVSGGYDNNNIIRAAEGVTTFVEHQGAKYTAHDFWLPSMSAPIALDMEWSDVSGKFYLPRTRLSEGKIGVKWAGNPEFEHQQHRLFPEHLMFDAVKGFDCISLQKEGKSPEWMEKPSLESWEDTREQVSRCQLVITSCTGVAHLSAGMGVETWIVIPVLPYYLWAKEGNTSPHYDSVRLFRQEKHGDWETPFYNLKKALRMRIWGQKELSLTAINQL